MAFDEVAKVCEKILALDADPGFHLYQLGSENSLSMKEIAQYIIDQTQSRSRLHCVNKPASSVVDWDFEFDKARHEISFDPVTIQSSLDNYIAKERENAHGGF
jgi:nucleoside-diphosphate-sugar epimerase